MGKITFGQGLGDMFYVILLMSLMIFYAVVLYKNIQGRINQQIILSVVSILFIILFTLKMTIYRGIEYPWNGNIFFQ